MAGFVHCVPVVPVTLYFQLDWCIISALAFQLAQSVTCANDWHLHTIDPASRTVVAVDLVLLLLLQDNYHT